MKKYVKATFDNNYGCIEEHYYKIGVEDDIDIQVGEQIYEDFNNFCGKTCGHAKGYGVDGWESEELKYDYYDNCSWEFESLTEEEYQSAMED